MTAVVIDGKAFAAKVRAQVAAHVARLREEQGLQPGLAVVLVGEDPASQVYVRNKHASTVEVGRIFANSLSSEQALPPEDVKYVGQVVAQHTGMSQQEAEKRVTDVYGKVQTQAKQAAEKAKQIADEARKASAYAALWLFVSLLLGAFVASLMATFGGRQRDL